MKMMKVTNFKLGIGIPLSFPMVHADFFESYALMKKGAHVLLRARDSSVDVLRNGLVILARKAGCTHLMMLDADMAYQVETIPTLLAHDLPVVGALCFRRCSPFDPLMIQNDKTIRKWNDGELIEVERTGTGCILFSMEVFDKIEQPWFEVEKNEIGLVTTGEDYIICDKLRKAGYKIYVDTSVIASHLSTIRVDKDWYEFIEVIKTIKKEEKAKQQ